MLRITTTGNPMTAECDQSKKDCLKGSLRRIKNGGRAKAGLTDKHDQCNQQGWACCYAGDFRPMCSQSQHDYQRTICATSASNTRSKTAVVNIGKPRCGRVQFHSISALVARSQLGRPPESAGGNADRKMEDRKMERQIAFHLFCHSFSVVLPGLPSCVSCFSWF